MGDKFNKMGDSHYPITNLYLSGNMESKLKYLLVADNAIIDENSGKLSVIGLFGDINIPPEKELGIFSFVVAGELIAPEAKKGEQGKITVKIIDPDKGEFKSVDMRGSFDRGEKVLFTAFFSLAEFNKKGNYEIEVYLNDKRSEKDDRPCYFRVN